MSVHPLPSTSEANQANPSSRQPGQDDAANWLTRVRIAELARCSDQTIDREVKKHSLEHREGPNGSKLYNVQDFIAIGRLSAEDLPTGLTPGQAVEVLRLKEQLAHLQHDNGVLTGRLEGVRQQVALLTEQLQAKDAQLRASDANLKAALGLARAGAA